MNPTYSLVVPLYNEAGNLLPLLQSTFDALAPLLADGFEVILVNDGSTDATAAEIDAAMQRWAPCRALHHAVNRGQAQSLFDGLKAARGEIILTMDGDGQNDPADFPLLLKPVRAGTLDLACGWRITRRDPWLRRSMSVLGNAIRRRVLSDTLHDNGCQLRVMRRAVVEALFPVEFMQSFLPSIAMASGFRVAEFPVSHHPRTRGHAHFGLRQLWWKPAAAMFKVRSKLRSLSRK